MKSYSDIENALLESGDIVSRGISSIINNMGKAVAVITAAITCLVTFTDISFVTFAKESFLPSLLLLLTSAYVIYFSLEDAGEKLGERTEEYGSASERYKAARARLSGEDVEPLRELCKRYSEEELAFRKRAALLRYGLSEKELCDYVKNPREKRRSRRLLARIAALKPSPISPRLLLNEDGRLKRGELECPEKHKLPSLLLKLVPTTLCRSVTVSVILSAKTGLTAPDVINALLKLSSLPVVGFRGYSAGYLYAKRELSSWLDTRAGILECFLKQKGKEDKVTLPESSPRAA